MFFWSALFSDPTQIAIMPIFLLFTGVLTPGYAFKDTSLVRRLNENGVTFDVTVNNINTIAKS